MTGSRRVGWPGGVIYNEKRGGDIDNLSPTFARASTDLVAANQIIPVTYQGIRVEALYRFNEDRGALLAQSYQSLEADAVLSEMAANSLMPGAAPDHSRSFPAQHS